MDDVRPTARPTAPSSTPHPRLNTRRTRHSPRIYLIPFLALLLIVGGIIYYTQFASAVTYTWDNDSLDGKWSTCANWSSNICPGASDIALFTSATTSTSTIDASFAGSVAGIQIDEGYTGVIIFARSLTVGVSDYVQRDGTVNLGGYTLNLNDDFFATTSTAVFNAATGTVNVPNTSAGTTFDVYGTTTLYNLTFADASTHDVATGDTFVVQNALTFTDGVVNGPGIIEMQGATTTVASTADGGSAQVRYLVAGDQYVVGASTAGRIPGIYVNKSSGTLYQWSSLGIGAGDLTIENGTFAMGTSTTSLYDSGADLVVTNGTLDGGTATLNFNNTNTFNASSSATVYNLTKTSTATVTISSGDTLVVQNSLTFTDGVVNGPGIIEMQGATTTVASTADGGSTQVRYLVSGDQYISGTSTGSMPGLYIDKPLGSVIPSADLGVSTLTLVNSTFTAPSGTLTIRLPIADGVTATVFTISGGTFAHNSGTLTFNPGISRDTATANVNVPAGTEFYNLIGTGSYSCCYGTYHLIAFSNPVVVRGDLVTDGPRFSNDISLYGDFTFRGRHDYSSRIIFMGAGVKTYKHNLLYAITDYANAYRDVGPSIVLNDPDVVVVPETPTQGARLNRVDVQNGTFAAPSGMLHLCVARTDQNGTPLTIANDVSASFEHNNGTVYISCAIVATNRKTINVPEDTRFYDLYTHATYVCCGGFFGEFYFTNPPTVEHLLRLGTGEHLGSIQVAGNTEIALGADEGAGTGDMTITYTGPNNQTYTNLGGDEPDGDITVNKTGGSLTLASNADWNAASQDLIITSGVLIQPNTYNLSTNALTVGSGGIFKNVGTGDITLGGNVLNNGRVYLMSRNGCGGTDDILLQSSSAGVQRSWTGSGQTWMYDLSVKDQGGTLPITAISSTNISNNGANWAFAGVCPPPASVRVGAGTTLKIASSTTVQIR